MGCQQRLPIEPPSAMNPHGMADLTIREIAAHRTTNRIHHTLGERCRRPPFLTWEFRMSSHEPVRQDRWPSPGAPPPAPQADFKGLVKAVAEEQEPDPEEVERILPSPTRHWKTSSGRRAVPETPTLKPTVDQKPKLEKDREQMNKQISQAVKP